MFHKEKLRSIKAKDHVLEIGPGALPHPRADIYLERIFETEEGARSQRGDASRVAYQKPVVYYDGGRFPFEDEEFDYVICSHVLEHIPLEELQQFISEIQRIAHKGYIEFPSVFYEFINYSDVHKWFMNYRSGSILFLDKTTFKSNNIHKIFRELFYGKDPYMHTAFKRFKDFFFLGFEWAERINFKIVDDFDDLIDEDDLVFWKEYFSEKDPVDNKYKKFPIIRKIIRFIKYILIIFFLGL